MFDTLCPAVYKQLRLRAGLTQAQLGTALDASRMTVMRFESGRARPERHQEAKLKELARCSDEQFSELICERLSALIGRRVGIHQNDDAYEATTALATAYALLDQHATELRPEHIRSLQDKISLSQFLGLALEKSNAGLEDYTRECRDLLNDDGRERAC